MKKCLFFLMCITIILNHIFIVYSQEEKVNDILKFNNLNEIQSVHLEKNSNSGKLFIDMRDKSEMKKFWDAFVQLPITNEKTLDSNNDVIYCFIDMTNNDSVSFDSNKGFIIKNDKNEETIAKYIDYKKLISILLDLDVQWHSYGSVEPMNPPEIVPAKNIAGAGPILSDSERPIDKASKDYEVKFLNQNGIIIGDPDGDLRIEDGVTRAEFAAVLCRAMGCEIEAQEDIMKQKKYFPDVSSEHWAIGYINFAYENGAINGFPDGNFYPEKPVTNEQVIKMLIAAWGYDDEAEENGGYPNGYMKVAKEHGILDTISFNYANASKRWVVSVFVYGVLSIQPENDEIKLPVKTELISVDVPRQENDRYVEKPEEILKNVSKESSFYERTVFEQQVPENYSPIKIIGKTVMNIGDKDYIISIDKSEHTGNELSADFKKGDTIDLSSLKPGSYSFAVGYKDDSIGDTYFGVFIITDKLIMLESLLSRYTTLMNVIQFDEKIEEIALSNSKVMGDIPFDIKSTSDGNEYFTLCINYLGSLTNEEEFRYAINDMDLKFSAHDRFIAPMDNVEPIIIMGLNENKEYNIQISYLSKHCNKSVKGILTANNDDFTLDGTYVISNMK